MKKRLFAEFVACIKEAGKIHRGEARPSRRFVFEPEEVRRAWEKLRRPQPEVTSA
jgi:hypothetical protein